MRRRALFSLAASCLLAACAHQTPTAMPGMAWSLHNAEGEGAKLAFGQPASDNVVLMMTCQPRSGDVLVSLTTAPNAPSTIELRSRGASDRYAGQSTPSFGAMAFVEAQAKASDRALVNFARSGDLAIVENGRRTPLPVRAGEKAQISRFFERCAS